MRPYTVFINEQALLTAPRSGKNRESVLKFIRLLANDPNTAGDFIEKEADGRVVQVKVVERYAITYWADHAVREIKVTHIRSADH